MIALAEVDERADPLGCRYVREDAAAFTPAAPVDIVTAVYLLNYARRILPTVAGAHLPPANKKKDPGYAGICRDIVTAVYLLARRMPTVADFRPRTKKRDPGYAGICRDVDALPGVSTQ